MPAVHNGLRNGDGLLGSLRPTTRVGFPHMTTPFNDLADGPCAAPTSCSSRSPPSSGPVDAAAARARLDEEARRLFGAPRSPPPTARTASARCSSTSSRSSRAGPGPRVAPVRPAPRPAPRPPAARRRTRRRAAAPRRRRAPRSARRPPAGSSASATRTARCCSTRGCSAHDDPCPEPRPAPLRARGRVLRLTGLAERFAHAGRRSPARLALALRLALPVDEAIRIALQRDLDAFGPA